MVKMYFVQDNGEQQSKVPPIQIHSGKQPFSHLPNSVQWTSPERKYQLHKHCNV